jgi:hypothetical protein
LIYAIILSEYEGVAVRAKFAESIDRNQVRRFIDIIKTVGIAFIFQVWIFLKYFSSVYFETIFLGIPGDRLCGNKLLAKRGNAFASA